MQLRSTLNKNDFQKIKKLYIDAFPPEERPPFFLIERQAKNNPGSFLVIEEGNQFVGFMILVMHQDLVYLAFFAIDDACRGKGYGSQALQLLKERYADKKILLARETLEPSADNYEQRIRRYGFYLRNGFNDIPCFITEGGVAYDAMCIHGIVHPEEYQAMIKAWSTPLLRRLIGFSMTEKK